MKDYFRIGKLAAVHGLKGEMVLVHNLGKKTAFKGLEAMFIEDKSASFIPWFLEAARAKNDSETYIKFEGVNQREQAIPLTQKEVWLPEEEFKKFSAVNAPINLLGFTIIHDKKELGKIAEVIEQPHQILCLVLISNKEAYIPLHDESILKIDRKKKEVTVDLPEGLLEIYQ